ncbi:Stp1/IreP family PP2C-type Ser/Thr phosphatase [Niabella aquatica]
MSWFLKRNNIQVRRFRSRAVLEGLAAVIATDKGNVRSNNEDGAVISFTEGPLQKNKGCLLMLADGMGGHNSGEIASEMALSVFATAYFNHRGNICKSLKYALRKANHAVFEASLTDSQYSGMGTTITAVMIKDSSIYLAHVGDSRAYLLGKDGFLRLSKDQTVVQQLVDMGLITEAQAASHPERNVLLSALGTKPLINGDVLKADIAFDTGNTLLLCSDGLYDLVADEEMAAIINTSGNITAAANSLVSEAKKRGGHDNITVLLATSEDQSSIPRLKSTRDFEIP